MQTKIILIHIALSIILFFLVNWLGSKSRSIGYVEFSSFTDDLESPLFNFFFRVVSPVVFIIIVSAIFYAFKLDYLVYKIFLITIYYFAIRWITIIALSRSSLTNWLRQLIIGLSSIGLSYLLYKTLIIEKKNILPDPGELANELWIIIILFLYNVLNKLSFQNQAYYNRKSNYIEARYEKFKKRYAVIVDNIIQNEKLKCLTYSIMIYEDFNRPLIVRNIENLSFWLTKKEHSLGIMQVKTKKFISNKKSVELGAKKIQAKYEELKKTLPEEEKNEYNIAFKIFGDYNKDDKYVYQVNSIMESLEILKFQNITDSL